METDTPIPFHPCGIDGPQTYCTLDIRWQARRERETKKQQTLMAVAAAGMTSGEAKPCIKKVNIAVRCSG